ncbi:MAG TPA: macrolide ABC transporter permease/ATP-binding protein MacB [Planctomycetes bacterium]|nr:macrolide ABC transporter permease/ATP-binding protein MacB [Planctomycetota bacterium]
MAANLISIRGLSRIYRMGDNEVRALDQIDLDIAEGEFVAIVGPSGSGKSTLMYVLGCLDRPSDGSYLLGGVDVGALDDAALSQVRNREIGYIFQSFNLLNDLSVVDNVALGLVYAGEDPARRQETAQALATRFGLGNRLSHTPNELSGGQMQRVAIARGLACRPRLVLADEPTGNLDSRTGAEIMAMFRRLNAAGHTVVLVTHDPGVAAQADRAVRIVDGKIVSDESNQRPAGEPSSSSGSGRLAAGGDIADVPKPQGEGVIKSGDTLRIAVHEGLLAHKMRSALTMLGIVFGIASVIAMTAITEGGKQRQLEQIRQIGMNAIQVRSLNLDGARLLAQRRVNPDGITTEDLTSLRRHIDGIEASAAWKELKAEVRLGDRLATDATPQGVTGDLQAVLDFHVEKGRFLDAGDESAAARVCVLGADVAASLEATPGSAVTVGDQLLTVVGVMGRKAYATSEISDIAISNRNRDVYLPYSTLRAYYRKVIRDTQVDAIALRMASDEGLVERSQLARRIVSDLHRGAEDFIVSVPLETLRQAQATREVFNLLIIVIAAISLIVGGIGIMNIMLATVTERTREIGIRRAVGASRRTVLAQFLAEASMLSLTGGIIGLLAGVAGALAVEAVFGFTVAFDPLIAVLAVCVSVAIGIGFGLYPAWKAARMDPVEALRN